MELYFAPLACSMSTRIAVYEAGGEAQFHCVDTRAKRVLADDSDFWALNPLGMVPVLRTEEGELLRRTPRCCNMWQTIFRQPALRRPVARSATSCSNG